MIIHEDSKILYFTPEKIDNTQIYLPQNFKSLTSSITKINNKYYCFKYAKPKNLINELLGSYFAKKIGLNAVDYKIGMFNNDLYALSEVFFDPNYSYGHCDNLYGTTAIEMYFKNKLFLEKYYLNYLKMLKKVKNKDMLEQLLKLILVDIKMGQTDRNDRNLMLKVDNETKEISLAPIYDFEESYEEKPNQCERDYYDNSFIILRKNFISFFMFLMNYPSITNDIKLLCNISTNEALDDIEQSNQIIFSDYEKKYYEEKDGEYTSILKRII